MYTSQKCNNEAGKQTKYEKQCEKILIYKKVTKHWENYKTVKNKDNPATVRGKPVLGLKKWDGRVSLCFVTYQ